MFENLANAVNQHYEKEIEKFINSLYTIKMGTVLTGWYYRQYTTPKTEKLMSQLDPESVLTEEIRAKMVKKFSRMTEKERIIKMHRLEAAASAPDLESAIINVEWVKSRTWGHNPHAEIDVYGEHVRETTTGSASGCGYDKESAAIAHAANSNPMIMKILYNHAENGGKFPYSVITFAGLPSFDGGCGVSCFRSVFEVCGYKWEDVAHGNRYDVYSLRKEG